MVRCDYVWCELIMVLAFFLSPATKMLMQANNQRSVSYQTTS